MRFINIFQARNESKEAVEAKELARKEQEKRKPRPISADLITPEIRTILDYSKIYIYPVGCVIALLILGFVILPINLLFAAAGLILGFALFSYTVALIRYGYRPDEKPTYHYNKKIDLERS